MSRIAPITDLDSQFSSPAATAVEWDEGRKQLEQAQIYWVSTVRPDGRPHVTPLVAIWLDDSLYFSTGAQERKGRNLAQNAHCVITTGCNSWEEGLDVVVEGDALNVIDEVKLQRVADAYVSKYNWKYTVADGALRGDEGNVALVYEVTPITAFGFGKGEPFSQTRWRF
jgi:nitroimidazol reductase NimA-like FMN-containing flavoprotein (pyridoxamine 5'-phosphate oxidase superfamily)